MFDLFRSRARSVRILLGALMVLVALSMLTYLIPSYGTAGPGGEMVVAEIGGEPLHMFDVQKILQQQLRNRQVPEAMIPHMVPQVIEAIITERALAYQAERLGFRVTDADVAETIRTLIPALYQGGRFVGTEAYAAMLAQQNVSIAEFEGDIRRQLLATRLRDLVLHGSVVTTSEIEEEYRLRNEKVKIEYVKLDTERFRAQVQATPEEIEGYFTARATTYQIPEKRNLAILVLDQEGLAQTVQPTDADIERLYNQDRDRFRVPERVKVRHILLKTTGDATKDAGIQAKAEELLKQIKGGANFGELAKKHSEDPGSAERGGELGDWVTRGQMVPEFEQAAFSLPLNQTSDLVKTQYGFHIVQVLAREEAHMRPLAEVKAELTTEWKNRRVAELVEQTTDAVQAALQKDPTAVAKVAAEHNLKLVRAEQVTVEDKLPVIGEHSAFQETVWMMDKGEVSQPVALTPTQVAMALVTDVFPARQAKLDEVRDRVRDAVLAEKAGKLIAERADALVQKTNSLGGDLRKAAQSMGLEVRTSEEFGRAEAVEGLGPASYLEEAFTKPVGTVIGPLGLPDSRVVARVAAHRPADMSKLAEQRDSLRQEIKQRKARQRNSLFEAGVRQQLIRDGKVKINEDVVNRLIANYRG